MKRWWVVDLSSPNAPAVDQFLPAHVHGGVIVFAEDQHAALREARVVVKRLAAVVQANEVAAAVERAKEGA